jgi:Tfp pilus assembly protein PilN
MSLRVNLIREPEQRSGSSLNAKSFSRIASVVVPVALAILIAQQTLSSFMLSSQLNILESQWNAIEPKQKLAIKQTTRLNYNKMTIAELEGWAAARPSWSQTLAAIMQVVPETIQLTALRATLVIPAGSPPPATSIPVRNYALSLDGVTRVHSAKEAVQLFEANLRQHPLLTPLLETVTVANFAADEASDDESSRIFTIQCKFKTLPIKEKH